MKNLNCMLNIFMSKVVINGETVKNEANSKVVVGRNGLNALLSEKRNEIDGALSVFFSPAHREEIIKAFPMLTTDNFADFASYYEPETRTAGQQLLVDSIIAGEEVGAFTLNYELKINNPNGEDGVFYIIGVSASQSTEF